MLRPEYCEMLLEEVDNYSQTGLPIRRPNSMNNYGIILNEVAYSPRQRCPPSIACMHAYSKHLSMLGRAEMSEAASIGMRPMLNRLQQEYLWPIARELFPVQGSQFDWHHSFIVEYQQAQS
eukprot:scaffold41856_cov38-Prasinocladus_malaysianus.AAC.1